MKTDTWAVSDRSGADADNSSLAGRVQEADFKAAVRDAAAYVANVAKRGE